MKIIQIIFILIITFTQLGKTFAFTSENFVNINYDGTGVIEELYVVPEGKNLIINNIVTESTETLSLFDSGSTIATGNFSLNKKLNLVIKYNLSALDTNIYNHYIITGILVNEEEDIDGIVNLNNDGINKNIFTKSTLEEIYKYEGVLMLFITFITFFLRISGKKRKGTLFFWKN